MQATGSARRSGIGRWLMYGYMVMSLAALVWTGVQWHALGARGRQLQAQLVDNTLLGVVQNLEAVAGVSSAGGDPRGADPLVNAGAAVAQVEIALFGYSEVTGQNLPHDGLLPDYHLRIMSARREQEREGKLSPETLERLQVLAADLRALRAAYPTSLLARAEPEELAAVQARLPELLKAPEAQSWLRTNP